MKRFIKYVCAFAFFASLASCYQSEDNYAYEPTRDFFVVDSLLESNYVVTAMMDTLNIMPVITMNNENDEVRYEWTIFESESTGEEEDLIVTVISEEKDLHYIPTEKPNDYIVIFKAENMVTGQMDGAKFNIKVTNEYSRGYYVLKESAGNTEIDLHLIPDFVKPSSGNKIDPDVWETIPCTEKMENLISGVQGSSLTGTPTSFTIIDGYCYMDDVTGKSVLTSTISTASHGDYRMIDLADFSCLRTRDNIFMDELSFAKNEEVIGCNYVYYGISLLTENGACYGYYDAHWGGGGTGLLNDPAYYDEKGYSPNVNTVSTYSYYNNFFDDKNGRFLYQDYNGNLHGYSDEYGEEALTEFTPNGIEHKLVYYGLNSTLTDAEDNNYLAGVTVFEDKNLGSAKKWIYILNLDGGSMNPLMKVTTIEGMKLNEASVYATNEDNGSNLYFSIGNKLYLYRLDTEAEEEVQIDGIGSGEEITYMRNYSHTDWMFEEDDYNNPSYNYLVVGTQSGDNYKVYMYNLRGPLVSPKPARTFEGTGKIKEMSILL